MEDTVWALVMATQPATVALSTFVVSDLQCSCWSFEIIYAHLCWQIHEGFDSSEWPDDFGVEPNTV